MGVCEVRDITKLTEDNGRSFDYYVLRSVYDKTKVSYIPVEGHKVMLRGLMTRTDAEEAYKKLLTENIGDAKEKAAKPNDPLITGEIAYVLHRKPEDLFPDNAGDE